MTGKAKCIAKKKLLNRASKDKLMAEASAAYQKELKKDARRRKGL